MQIARLAVALALGAGIAGPARASSTELLYSFGGAALDGTNPVGGLVVDGAGALLGTAQLGGPAQALCGKNTHCGGVFRLAPPVAPSVAWTESMVGKFTGGAAGGFQPTGGLVAFGGAFYGRTRYTGMSGNTPVCSGLIFRLTPPTGKQTAWTTTTLATLPATPSCDSAPALAVDSLGALYGVSATGGVNGMGSVFRLRPPAAGQTAWQLDSLHDFAADDGAAPDGPLLLDGTGALFGTASAGGPNKHGTIFQLAPPAAGQTVWRYSMLYSFGGPGHAADGLTPSGALSTGNGGTLYGTTRAGGKGGQCAGGCGVVYRLIPPSAGLPGWTYSTMYAFTGGADGAYPDAGVTFAPNGVLYGATPGGATQIGTSLGTVFQVRPPTPGYKTPHFSLLHGFAGGATDGCAPIGSRIFVDAKGKLYGTTAGCGAFGVGTVFRVTP